MTKEQKLAKTLIEIGFGCFAIYQGNIVGLKGIAFGLMDIVSLGKALSGSEILESQEDVLKKLKQVPEFSLLNLGRIQTLLSDTPSTKSFKHQDLITATEQAQNGDIVQALAKKVHCLVPFDQDDDLTKNAVLKFLKIAIEISLKAPEAREGLSQAILIELLIRQTKQTKDQLNTTELHSKEHKEIGAELRALRGLIEKLRRTRENSLVLDRFPNHPDQQLSTFVSMSFNERRTEFIGRAQEHEEIREFLEDDRPLLWWQIAGSAGQGKSRLALNEVDNIDPSWNAGFLSLDQLSKTDWAEVTIHEPTLIVIDYIGSQNKQQHFASALKRLEERFQTNARDVDRPESKIRFLLLEREGFALDDGDRTKNWLAPILEDSILEGCTKEYAYRKSALELKSLSIDDMKAIAQSWRKHANKNLFQDSTLVELIKRLNPPMGEEEAPRRIWRPLFAMIFAEFWEGLSADNTNRPLRDILFNALKHEKRRYWRLPDNNMPPAHAQNLAVLTTMLGELDPNKLINELSSENRCAEEVRTFYFGEDRENITASLAYTWRILGFNVTVARDENGNYAKLRARTPDLLGEAMVLWCLSEAIDPIAGDKSRIEQIAHDVWKLGTFEFLGFLLRLFQDFPKERVYQALVTAPIPGEIKENLGKKHLRVSAYLGLKSVVEQSLQDESELQVLIRKDDNSALIAAAAAGHGGIAQFLIQKGFSVNSMDEQSGAFPLVMAAQNGHTEVVSLLLDKGANVDQVDLVNGTFPLLQAAQQGHTEVVKRLLDKGANVDQQHQPTGSTALHAAVYFEHVEVIKALHLAHAHADISADLDGLGKLTARELAKIGGNPEIISLLEEIPGK